MTSTVDYDFLKIVEDTLSSIIDHIDQNYSEFLIDVEEHDGVLKVELVEQSKVFVVNKNSYLKELWYSSPVSGPHHFKYDVSSKKWITKNFEFFSLICSEIDYILCS